MAILKTLLPTNLFRFVCPIFGAEVELRGCLALRDKLWRGEVQPIRQGCQACLRASKCPIVPMMTMLRSEKGGDPYYSAEPKVGRLLPDLLKRIAAVVVPDQILKTFDIQPRQRELILETNGAGGAKKLKGSVDLGEINVAMPSEGHREPPPKKLTAKKPAPETDLNEAARTGDMSAAINAAMSETAAPAA